MKKYSWIVALLLALSLAFFGCYVDEEDEDDGDGGDGEDLPEYFKTLELQRSDDGWEVVLELLPTPAKNEIQNNGDTYVFEWEFTVELHNAFDFDASTKLQVLFVDLTQAAGWWDDTVSDGIDIEQDTTNKWDGTMKGKEELKFIKDTEKYKGDITESWGVHDDWGGVNNAVVFKIDEADARGNSKIVLNFSKFDFKKK
jgi:hypothetical protein